MLGDTIDGPLAISGGYDPFGESQNDPTDLGFGYRGELHLGTHVYLRARDLDPDFGRFTSVDPLEGTPGTTTVANQYAYASNDPVQQLDPLGLRSTDREIIRFLDTNGGFDGFEHLGVLETAGFIRQRVSELFDGFGLYMGDDRGVAFPKPIPADRSRFFARIDFEMGEGFVQVNETKTADNPPVSFPPFPVVFNKHGVDIPN